MSNRNTDISNENDERDRLYFDFEDHFNMNEISEEKIQFAKYYLEDKMGIDLEEDPVIVFSSINGSVFGYLVAHIVDEYLLQKKKSEDGM
ncbi:MAG: hypothetical protein KKG99_03530 [Bacteroidetes bacterium]|nr:hypothetical protein [Bacteroidota bacterium]